MSAYFDGLSDILNEQTWVQTPLQSNATAPFWNAAGNQKRINYYKRNGMWYDETLDNPTKSELTELLRNLKTGITVLQLKRPRPLHQLQGKINPFYHTIIFEKTMTHPLYNSVIIVYDPLSAALLKNMNPFDTASITRFLRLIPELLFEMYPDKHVKYFFDRPSNFEKLNNLLYINYERGPNRHIRVNDLEELNAMLSEYLLQHYFKL